MKSEIEVFRIVCMLGIVWFHSGLEPGRQIAHGGLIFFIVTSVFFAVTAGRRHSLPERAKRLLVPWGVWSVFYGMVSWCRWGHCFPEGYHLVSMLLATPSIHLWFLPFLFLVLVGIDLVRELFFRRKVVVLIGTLSFLSVLTAPFWEKIRLVDPFTQYLYSVPAVLIGIFLAAGSRTRHAVFMPMMAGLVLSLLILAGRYRSEVGILYLVGILPAVFLLYDNVLPVSGRWLFTISSSVFGVYLVHPFCQMFLRYLGLTSYALPLINFFLSLVSVLLMKRVLPARIAGYIV
ncbi:acyltransferase family protein [Thermodesulfobacteriota bacterium B35]